MASFWIFGRWAPYRRLGPICKLVMITSKFRNWVKLRWTSVAGLCICWVSKFVVFLLVLVRLPLLRKGKLKAGLRMCCEWLLVVQLYPTVKIELPCASRRYVFMSNSSLGRFIRTWLRTKICDLVWCYAVRWCVRVFLRLCHGLMGACKLRTLRPSLCFGLAKRCRGPSLFSYWRWLIWPSLLTFARASFLAEIRHSCGCLRRLYKVALFVLARRFWRHLRLQDSCRGIFHSIWVKYWRTER